MSSRLYRLANDGCDMSDSAGSGGRATGNDRQSPPTPARRVERRFAAANRTHRPTAEIRCLHPHPWHARMPSMGQEHEDYDDELDPWEAKLDTPALFAREQRRFTCACLGGCALTTAVAVAAFVAFVRYQLG